MFVRRSHPPKGLCAEPYYLLRLQSRLRSPVGNRQGPTVCGLQSQRVPSEPARSVRRRDGKAVLPLHLVLQQRAILQVRVFVVVELDSEARPQRLRSATTRNTQHATRNTQARAARDRMLRTAAQR